MPIEQSPLLRSFAWKFLERFSVQGVQFLVQLILARLLAPEDYGKVAVVAAVIAIMNVVLQSGTVKALIQFKNINSVYFSSAFFGNLCLSVALYGALFFSAPALSHLIGVGEFSAIARVLGLSLVIGVFNTIQDALAVRHGKYKRLFLSSTAGVLVSGAAGIACAAAGAGLWSLVAQQLANQAVCAVVLWLQSGYSIKPRFSLSRLGRMARYSWKISLSSFIEVAFQNIQSIALGRMFSVRTLGFVAKGQQFPLLVVANIDGTIQPIMLRELSLRQGDPGALRDRVRKVETVCAFLLFPVLAALIVNSENIVGILLSERWLPSSRYLVVFTLAYMFVPFNSLNIQVPNAIGKTAIYLRNEMVKKILGVALLGAALPFGINSFCVALVVYGCLSFVVDARTTGTLIGYGLIQQIRGIVPYAALASIAGAATYPFRLLGMGRLPTLALGLASIAGLYLLGCHVFRLEGYHYASGLLHPTGVNTIFRSK